MAKYGRFLYYKRNSANIQTQYLAVTLTIKYNTSVYLAIVCSFLYNITGVDARSLWEPKHPGQALWTALVKNNPAEFPTVSPTGFLEMEDGSPLLMEDGGHFDLE